MKIKKDQSLLQQAMTEAKRKYFNRLIDISGLDDAGLAILCGVQVCTIELYANGSGWTGGPSSKALRLLEAYITKNC